MTVKRIRASGDVRPATSTLALANLIIPGEKKAGAISLFHYLARHPEICTGNLKHTHFFRPLVTGGELPPIAEYARCFAHCGRQPYRMEASTDYFSGGERLTKALEEYLDEPRVLISLRDPVTRLWSHFKHKKRESSNAVAGLTFEEFIDRCEEVERRNLAPVGANRGYSALPRGRYIDFLEPWLNTFGDRLLIVFFEQWATQPHKALPDIHEWLGIAPAPVPEADLEIENVPEADRSSRIGRLASVSGKVGSSILEKNRRMRAALRSTRDVLNREEQHETLDPRTRRRLRDIYLASNRRLLAELVERGYQDLPTWLTTAQGPKPDGSSLRLAPPP